MKTLIVSSLGEETIQVGKLFKGGNYMRKYGMSIVGGDGNCTTFLQIEQSYISQVL